MDLAIHLEAYAYEAVTVSNVAVGFTAATIVPSGAAPARCAAITAENASCRFRIDGANPTAADGHLLNSGDSLVLWETNNLQRFRAIRTAGVDAMLRITYLR